MAEYGEHWSDTELSICVEVYAQAVAAGGTKKRISRDIYESRAFKKLNGRVMGAVTRRMCNISAMLEKSGEDWVQIWKPMRNVGTGVEPRLLAILQQQNLL